jgi:hypothetical protein
VQDGPLERDEVGADRYERGDDGQHEGTGCEPSGNGTDLVAITQMRIRGIAYAEASAHHHQ